jgi:hypothetical protein
MSDHDDTPALPPPHPANREALAKLADVAFELDDGLRGVRMLARALRRFREPPPAVWRIDLAARAKQIAKAAELAARIAKED